MGFTAWRGREIQSGRGPLSPSVADLVATKAEGRRRLALAYFKQEGLTDGVPWGLVDLGWNGRLQSSLDSLIGAELRYPINGLYFALHNKPVGVGTLQAYFCDSHAGLGSLKSSFHAPMMEMFCTAPHGSTTGYEERGGRVEPVFVSDDERLRTWGVDIVHGATLEFARHLRAIHCHLSHPLKSTTNDF